MGLKSFGKKLKKYTKKAVGAQFGGITGALGADKIMDFVNDPTGAKAAAKDLADELRAAGREQEALAVEIEAIRAERFAQSAPFREQGRLDLERLQGQRPGESQFFTQGVERGTESIAEQRARFGLVSSGGTQREFEGLTSDLLLQEELYKQQGIGRAAQLSQTGYDVDLNLLREKGGALSRASQSRVGAAQAKGQGRQANRGFYLDLATQAAGVGGGYFLGGPAGAAQGAGGGGAPTSPGGYRTYNSPGGYGSLQEGTGYNQFLNPNN